MRFWVCFLRCFGGSTKTRCLQGSSSAFALAKATADSQNALCGAGSSPLRSSKAGANQNRSLRVRHPPRGDIMEEYKETFRLSPGFLSPGFPKSIAMHERVLKTPSLLSRATRSSKATANQNRGGRLSHPPDHADCGGGTKSQPKSTSEEITRSGVSPSLAWRSRVP